MYKVKLLFGLLEYGLEQDRQVRQTGLDLMSVKYQRQRRDMGFPSRIMALSLKGVVAYDVLFLVFSFHLNIKANTNLILIKVEESRDYNIELFDLASSVLV